MKAKDYYELFRYLAEQACMDQDSLVFVESIADWCKDHGIDERDVETPFKLIAKKDRPCFMLIKEDISADVIEERINAMRVRSQLKNVAFDRADMLNSPQKKLAYLYLSEYAINMPEVNEDPLIADNWAFEQMEKLGYFKT